MVHRTIADVFAYWYMKRIAECPGERPQLKWLVENSKIPLATCCRYRRRFEAAHPDFYAASQAKQNLRVSAKEERRKQRVLGLPS